MLILSRKKSQSILIGDNIRITVLRTHHQGSVVIGIEAPTDIVIIREELVTTATADSSHTKSKTRGTERWRNLLSRITTKTNAQPHL